MRGRAAGERSAVLIADGRMLVASDVPLAVVPHVWADVEVSEIRAKK